MGRDAKIGAYAFGFLWGSFVALLIADILFLFGMRSGKDRSGGGGRRFWRRNRSTRSRSYDGRRVKDEYS